MAVNLDVTFFSWGPHCYCYVNQVVMLARCIYMKKSGDGSLLQSKVTSSLSHLKVARKCPSTCHFKNSPLYSTMFFTVMWKFLICMSLNVHCSFRTLLWLFLVSPPTSKLSWGFVCNFLHQFLLCAHLQTYSDRGRFGNRTFVSYVTIRCTSILPWKQ